jgi:hypothetical protein
LRSVLARFEADAPVMFRFKRANFVNGADLVHFAKELDLTFQQAELSQDSLAHA